MYLDKLFIYLTLTLLGTSLSVASQQEVAPELTEYWEPIPPVVIPTKVPSDAIILFDGSNLNAWRGQDGIPAPWKIADGVMTVVPQSKGISTLQKFCDMQLHIEWRSPPKISGQSGQKLANSGIFLPGGYEIQILDSYHNQTYVNGQAGSVYKQSPPLVNAMAPTGEWNTYDIIFTAPQFNQDQTLRSPAYVSLLHNGILVQNHFEIKGATVYRGQPKYRAHGCGSVFLQEHNDAVSFRNIWVREL